MKTRKIKILLSLAITLIFTASLVFLMPACQKVDDDLQLFAGEEPWVLKSGEVGGDCSMHCIDPADPVYCKMTQQETISWGNPLKPFTKTVDILYFNTLTHFVLQVKSSHGWADLIIDGESVWNGGPVAADEWGQYQAELPPGWEAGDAYGFTLMVAGFGLQVSFEVDVALTGSCNNAVTFYVDMSEAVNFYPLTDVVYITGSFFDWAEPGAESEKQTMTRVDQSMVWSLTIMLPPGDYEYKYFLNSGWYGGEWAETYNRQLHVNADMTINDTWGNLYGDVPDHPVTFQVDMTDAVNFDPAEDVVFITGTFFGWAIPGDRYEEQVMTRLGDSMVWSISIDLPQGQYEYKYFLNTGWDGGEWDGGPNRVIDVDQAMTIDDAWGVLAVPE